MFHGKWFSWEEYKYREAVVWFILAMAFLLPCLYCYQAEEEIDLQMNLVSESQVIQNKGEGKELQLYARAAVLMDAQSQRVLYGKNENEILPMASTTKIMTCILAIESGCLEEVAEVSAYAASQPKVHAGLRSGEQYYVKDLLYSLMLESHNDTAVVIAEYIGGSVDGFAEMMNQKAEELGMTDTYFITPNGLDATRGERVHSTTAKDLAILASYAVQNELFLAITNTRNYSFADLAGVHHVSVSNKNAFLSQMEGAIGIKTGFTGNAGYCFVGAVRRNGITLISTVLACGWPPHKSYKWADTGNLMNYGFNHYATQTIYVPALERIMLSISMEKAIPIQTDRMELNALLSDMDQVVVTDLYVNKVEGCLPSGTLVGLRTIKINNCVVLKQEYITQENVSDIGYREKMNEILKLFYL